MLIDEVEIGVKAGDGGAGRIAFLKVLGAKGVAGGSGGRGGSIYVEGVSDLSALRQYRFKKEFKAENGHNGKDKCLDGRAGEDLILPVPIGTVVHNFTINESVEVTTVGQKVMVAEGGLGGRGNFHFRSSRHTTPLYAQNGLNGDTFKLKLELKLIADVGLIGFPNAGKSSLLNELTRASVKVANYPFTTLEPNLGAFYPAKVLKGSDKEQAAAKPVIMADIPGLIEGASAGKGLGHKFLRHIQRTKILLHCISCESATPVSDYKIIRKELTKHDPELAKKDEYILLTKTDMTTPADVKKRITALKKHNPSIVPVSIHDEESLEAVKRLLEKIV